MTEWVRLVVVFLVVVNPVRVWFGVPGRDRADRVRSAGVGAASAVVAVFVFAACATPLLDLWGASAPTLRIGAGILVVLGGARDVFASMPAAEPSARGWRAGLVPVALPLLVGPALLGVSLSAGADEGVWPALAAALPGFAVLAGLSVGGPPRLVDGGAAGRAASWAARLVGGLAVVVGVLLAADGVFAV